MSEIEPDEQDEVRELRPGVPEEEEKKGIFSPLFLLLVVGLPLLLAAMLVPNFVRARARGQLTACKSNLKNIGTALEMYSTDWSGKYPKELSQLTPKYLKTIPTCPSVGRLTYVMQTGDNVGYNTAHFQDYYVIHCDGPNHEAVSVPTDFPQYDGLRGLYER